MKSLLFVRLDEKSAREIVRWKYDPPYDIYNHRPQGEAADIRYMLDPANGFHGIRTGDGELIGFCSFGRDAQVRGGEYGADALDIGLGIRPDWTGRGMGAQVIRAVLGFAGKKSGHERYRVTIAAFNQRAQKAWKKARFAESQKFRRESDGKEFLILVRER